jgi:hypothetical protein
VLLWSHDIAEYASSAASRKIHCTMATLAEMESTVQGPSSLRHAQPVDPIHTGATLTNGDMPASAPAGKGAATSSAPQDATRNHSRSNAKLLAHLTASLNQHASSGSLQLGSNGKIRLHVLFSSPRQSRDLFPLAHVHPSHGSSDNGSGEARKGWLEPGFAEVLCEKVFVTASWEEEGGDGGVAASSSVGHDKVSEISGSVVR